MAGVHAARTSGKLVLGKNPPHLYQSMIDTDPGRIILGNCWDRRWPESSSLPAAPLRFARPASRLTPCSCYVLLAPPHALNLYQIGGSFGHADHSQVVASWNRLLRCRTERRPPRVRGGGAAPRLDAPPAGRRCPAHDRSGDPRGRHAGVDRTPGGVRAQRQSDRRVPPDHARFLRQGNAGHELRSPAPLRRKAAGDRGPGHRPRPTTRTHKWVPAGRPG